MHIPLSPLTDVCILELSMSTVVFVAVNAFSVVVVVVVDLVVTVVGAVVVTFNVVSVEIVEPKPSRRYRVFSVYIHTLR